MNAQSFRLVPIVLLAALLLTACSGTASTPEPTAVPQTTLRISGSGGATSVVKFLAGAYRQQHSDLAFEFLSGSGSGGGVKGVLEQVLDLGTMSRPPKDSELSNGIAYLVLGLDKSVVATSPDLSFTGLSRQQVKDIFLGKITNWSEVGGPSAPISVLVRDEEDSTTQVLRKEIFGDSAFTKGAAVFTSEGDMQTALSEATQAIGFLSYSGVRVANVNVHVLAIDGHDPADVDGDYPYARQLGVAYLPANTAKVQPFIDFINSPEAQALLASQGVSRANSRTEGRGDPHEQTTHTH